MKPIINFVAYGNREISLDYQNFLVGMKIVLIDQTSGQQLSAPVVMMDKSGHGSLTIKLPDSVAAGQYHLAALDPDGHRAAQSVAFYVS
jgi:methionine-rich copper-binding protein CopC